METNERIKRRRLELGLTMSDVAAALGVNRSTVLRYETKAIEKVPLDAIEPLARVLQTTKEYLLGWDNKDEELTVDEILRSLPNYVEVHKTKVIPILGYICAGDGIWCEENYDGHIAVDNKFRVDFALNVKGDSMTGANINDGDLALFQKTPDVENGQIAAVLLKEDNIVVLKKVYKKEDGSLRLQPSNDNYEPIITTDFIILGKFVGIYYKEMV